MKFAAVLLALFLSFGSAEAASKYYVVDGDSLNLSMHRIRLNGIDAPEYSQECYYANHKRYACGIKAYQHLKKLIGSGKVTCVENDIDIYKRSLSTCYVLKADGSEININDDMVRSGWAVAYRDEAGEYAEAEAYAKANKLGIWQGKFMKPQLYRILNK